MDTIRVTVFCPLDGAGLNIECALSNSLLDIGQNASCYTSASGGKPIRGSPYVIYYRYKIEG